MSAENVVINFVGNGEELKPLENILDNIVAKEGDIGEAWKKAANTMNTQTKAYTETTNKLGKSIESLIVSTKSMDKAVIGGAYKDYLKQIQSQLGLTSKELAVYIKNARNAAQQAIFDNKTDDEIKQITLSIEVMNQQLKELGEAEFQTGEKTKNLRTRIKEAKEELVNMAEAGLQGTPAFKKLQDQAGELDDQMRDLNATIKGTGSDTKHIDGMIGLASGVAGGFATAQGAVALFGDESEDMQKALLKVNAAMSVLQGLQEIQNLLQKESAAMLLLSDLKTKALAVSQTFLTATTMGSVAATYALRTALIASGIGAMVVLVGALAGAFDSMGDSAQESADKVKKANDEAKESLESYRKVAQNNELRINRDIDIIKGNELIKTLELQGGSLEKISALKKDILDKEIQTLKVDEAGIETASKKANDQTLFTQDLLKTRGEIYSKTQERNRLDLQLDKDLAETAKQRTEDAKKAKEERQKEIELIYKSITAQAEADIAAKKLNIIKNQTDSLKSINDIKDAEIEAIVARKNEALKADKLTAGERNKIEAEAILAVAELKKQAQIDLLEVEATGINAKLLLAAKGSEDEYNLKIEQINKQQEIELAATVVTAEKTAEIKNKAEIERLLAAKELRLAQLENDKAILDIEVQNAVEGSGAALASKIADIDKATEIELASIDEIFKATEAGKRKVLEINNRNKNEKIKLELEFELKNLDAAKNITDALRNSIIKNNEQIVGSVNASFQQRKKAEQDIYDLKMKGFFNEKLLIDQKLELELAAAQKIKGSVDLTAEERLAIENKYKVDLLKIQDDIDNQRFEKEQKALKKKADLLLGFIENTKRVLDESINVTLETGAAKTALLQLNSLSDSIFKTLNDKTLSQSEKNAAIITNTIAAGQQVINQLFSDSAAARQQVLNESVTQLNEQKAKELDNKNLTEQQKADIEARFKEKEKQIKIKAFEAEKEAKKQQAIINGALAITNILATVPKFDFGIMTAILIGAAISSTALQVAAINKAKPPAFKDGVIDLQGPGTTTSDSIHAKLSKGESVIKADATAKWKDALTAINENKFEPWLFDKFKDFVFPVVPDDISSTNNNSIDYDKLAEAVARKMAGIIPAEKSTHVNIDRDGIRTLVITENSKTEIKNKYFSMQ